MGFGPGAWRLGCILELGSKMSLRQHEEIFRRKQAQFELLGHFSIVGDSWKRSPLEPTLHVLEAGTELAATEPSSRVLCLPFYLFWFGGHTRQLRVLKDHNWKGLVVSCNTGEPSWLACFLVAQPLQPLCQLLHWPGERVSPDQGARVGAQQHAKGP